MKKIASIIFGAIALIGCAGNVPFTDPVIEATLPGNYCSVTWDMEGNKAMNCVQFMSKEEMEMYIIMTRKDCNDVSPDSTERAPRYKSDK